MAKAEGEHALEDMDTGSQGVSGALEVTLGTQSPDSSGNAGSRRIQHHQHVSVICGPAANSSHESFAMGEQKRLRFQLAWQKPWLSFPNQRLGNPRDKATPHGLLSFVVQSTAKSVS